MTENNLFLEFRCVFFIPPTLILLKTKLSRNCKLLKNKMVSHSRKIELCLKLSVSHTEDLNYHFTAFGGVYERTCQCITNLNSVADERREYIHREFRDYGFR